MQNTPALSPPLLENPPGRSRSSSAIVRLLVVAALVLFLQIPITMIEELTATRATEHEAPRSFDYRPDHKGAHPPTAKVSAESYRLVRRALKYEVLVFTLILASLFLFEVCAGLRLHPIHYVLVAAALCLFYLVLLSMVEIIDPRDAYYLAALASVALVGLYGAAILRSWARGGVLSGFISFIYAVLCILLELPDYALLAGTATLFALLASAMYFTRHINWDDLSRRSARSAA